MTAIKRFIEDAVKGGYLGDKKGVYAHNDRITWTSPNGWNEMKILKADILLDPKAWEAVAKVRGWEELSGGKGRYRTMMQIFVQNLCDNKNIEESLQAIE